MADKKEHFYIQHLVDLANRANKNNYPLFTDFMTTKEYSLCRNNQKLFSETKVFYWGGNSDCSHVISGFFPLDYVNYIAKEEDLYSLFPIACIEIILQNAKYARDISHRDYLGAILNLGIQRSMIGDIRINNHSAYVFCKKEFASFIIDNFTMVKHTPVTCKIMEDVGKLPPQEYSITNRSVSSLRLDNIVAAMIGSARGKANQLITQGYVVADGEERTSVSYRCHNEIIITIRGYGKYKLITEEGSLTKKGRQKITIYKYL